MWKEILHRCKWTGLILVSAIVAATLLQFLVFSLPTEPMEKHVKESVNIFTTEGTYHDTIPGIYTTKQDNYTDSAMLLQAIYDGDQSLSDRVMNDYANMVTNANYTDSLIHYCTTGQSDSVHTYFWYWHGYLILLKPLLLFFNYGDIRILNTFGQLVCLILLVLGLYKKGYREYILPFGAAFLFLSPMTINMSMQFSSCYYIMFISSIILLYYGDHLKRKNQYYLLFLLTGMGTSFVDFLTYPVVTVGLPLCLYFIINPSDSIKKTIQRMIELGFFWGIGYVLFWAGKWLVASIFLRENCFIQAINKITLQTSRTLDMNGGTFSYQEMFSRNFMWTSQKAYVVLFCGVLLYLLIRTGQKGIDAKGMRRAVPFVIIALLPICWYLFASTHAFFHYWMEYRECFLLLLGIFAALIQCRKQQNNQVPKRNGDENKIQNRNQNKIQIEKT